MVRLNSDRLNVVPDMLSLACPLPIECLEAREYDDAHIDHVASWAEKLATMTSAEMEGAFFRCDSARNFNIVRRTDRFGI